jgi:hypothetical protein
MRGALVLVGLLVAVLVSPLGLAQGALVRTGLDNAAVCFRDANDDGAYASTEAAFYQRNGCGTTAANDVRLSGAQFASKLKPGDSDLGVTTIAPPALDGSVWFVDDDANGAFNVGDLAYLKMTGGTEVHTGDVRLTNTTGLVAGVVKGSDGDVGAPAQAVANGGIGSDFDYFDADGSQAFDDGDVLYVDTDASDTISVRDIRIPPAAATAPTTCPTGQELQGGQCVAITCPTGQELQGSTCVTPAANETGQNQTQGQNQTDQDAAISAQLAALLQQNQAIAAQLNQTFATNAQLQAQLSQMSASLTNQTAQASALNTRIAQLQANNTALQAQLAAGGKGNATGGSATPGFEAAALVAVAVAVGVGLARRRR